jgi:multidrug efflux pump subunit AcrB
VDLPSLSITTRWNGASPQAVQRSITIPIENAVRNVHGVESVRSTSRSGQSQVEVEFRREIDIDFARLELNEHLGSVRRDLPLGATQPQVVAHVPEELQTDDFFTFSLESALSANELRDLAETWIIPRVLSIDGVADARVQGGARSLLKILLDRDKLELYGILADEVFFAVDQLDELAGAGAIRQHGLEKLVSLRDPIDVERLRTAVVARRGGRNYRLGMLAEVREDHEDPAYYVRANNQNVVEVVVDKRSNANSVGVSRNLRSALPDVEAGLPFAASFHVDQDQGKDLEEKLYELVARSLAILALLFLLLAVSLREVRLTAIITASILFAIVISLSLFYFLRISVNFITISGLTVCFGMLLDNSILVLDSIHRRLESLERANEAQLSRRAKLKVAMETIVEGTREVQFPIFATTLTTMAAFVSFIFLTGRLSLYYVPLAIAVAIAMSASLFVAFCWIPVVLNSAWATPLVRRSEDGPNDVTDTAALHSFVEDRHDLKRRPGFLERVVNLNQRLWWLIVPPVLVLLFWFNWSPIEFEDEVPDQARSLFQRVMNREAPDSIHVNVEYPLSWPKEFVYRDKVLKGGFWRFPDPTELLLYLEMPSGTDIQLASETIKIFEDAISPVDEGVRMRAVTFGYRGVIRVEFEKELLNTEVPTYYREVWVDMADRTGGVSIFIRGFADQPYFKGPFAGSSLNSLVRLTGYNSRQLNAIADETVNRIQRQRRVRNVRVTSGTQWGDRTEDETLITFKRRLLAEYGLTVADMLGHLRRLLGVDTPWTMLIDGEQERLQLAFDDSETMQYSDVADKMITTPSGERVRLGALVRLESRPQPTSVVREDQSYTLYVNWEYVGTDKMRQAYITRVLDSLDLPYGYNAEEARREFISDEEDEELTLAAWLAVSFIFILLAALFESVTLPFLVLFSLPMALAGVYAAFWITGDAYDSSARIGLVLLFGIVVNNAILLASRFRHESSLILKAKLGGDPEGDAGLFAGFSRRLGGTDLYVLDRKERAGLLRRAVARATRIRLRSILLTSGTTIVGLAPLLIPMPDALVEIFGGRETEGKDIWENLALTSIGGLISSTVLLLLALPPAYYVSVRISWILRRVYEGVRNRVHGRRRRPVRPTEPGPAVA